MLEINVPETSEREVGDQEPDSAELRFFHSAVHAVLFPATSFLMEMNFIAKYTQAGYAKRVRSNGEIIWVSE